MKLSKYFLIIILQINIAYSQWSNDPTLNNPIAATIAYQINPSITTDGFGGAIIAWDDYSAGSEYRVYAQRINYAGYTQWPLNGVQICDSNFCFSFPQIIDDGVGGAIITWTDIRNGTKDIYAQRINANGIVQWTNEGITICSATGNQDNQTIISSNNGGAIISWIDDRNGSSDIYAQLVDSTGAIQWTLDGTEICASTGNQTKISAVSDNNGGAILIWEDGRNGTNTDIYAQRISTIGTVLWTTDGIPICIATGYQYSPQIVSDNSNGIIATWQDDRGASQDIYAQSTNGSGVNQWTTDGIIICSDGDIQVDPSIIIDESGGAIISWEDSRNGASDIYAQKVNSIGATQWTSNGLPICNATNIQIYPQITANGSGGAIITWQDYRNANFDVYAQNISSSGIVQWPQDGVAVCLATGEQYSPKIISDNNNGAIMTWKDVRADGDIYAQKIGFNGVISVEEQTDIFNSFQVLPNPAYDIITISSIKDGEQIFSLSTVQGEIILTRKIFFQSGIPQVIHISNLSSGTYFIRIGSITKKMVKL